jgi:hypothetical protein
VWERRYHYGSEQTASHLELATKTWRLRHRFAAVFANGICVTMPFHQRRQKVKGEYQKNTRIEMQRTPIKEQEQDKKVTKTRQDRNETKQNKNKNKTRQKRRKQTSSQK